MALQVGRGKRCKVVLSPTLHPQYREVVHTYTQGMCSETVGEDLRLGDLGALAGLTDKDTACVIVQNPDFLGRLYSPAEMQALADKVHAAGAILVVSVDPISLGLFVPTGEYGADVVTGEGQPMGNSLSLGGPYLGFFAMKMADVRKSAGRIVGQTVDSDRKRGFVLTLGRARATHPPRQGLGESARPGARPARPQAIYIAAMGKHGLRASPPRLSYDKAHYAANLIGKLPGYDLVGVRAVLQEFVVRCPTPVAQEIEPCSRYGGLRRSDLESTIPR